MKVRTKAFLQTVGAVIGTGATIFTLDYLFPKYGLLVFWSGIMLYMLYIIYNMRVSTLESEQQQIIDQLKK